ncbi:hypothetical protein H1R20_g6507, partial [Candolleomyces eurysporus]
MKLLPTLRIKPGQATVENLTAPPPADTSPTGNQFNQANAVLSDSEQCGGESMASSTRLTTGDTSGQDSDKSASNAKSFNQGSPGQWQPEEDDYDREDDLDYKYTGEGDKDEDEEGVQVEDDSRRSHQRPKSKSKPKKAETGLAFRAQVNAQRSTTAKSDPKRKKVEEPSGLFKNFRATGSKKASTAPRSQSELPSDSDSEYTGGMFDEDEDETALKAVRASKSLSSKSLNTWGSKPKTTVCIVEPAPPALALAVSRCRLKKDQCKKSNLPFPGVHANRCRTLWDKAFKSTLIAWNATLGQLFSSGTLLSSESALVLKTFTYHLRQVAYRLKPKDYKVGDGRRAVGALGLCAAAVERALCLIRDGHITIDKWPPALLPPALEASELNRTGKRRKAAYTAFSESAWGGETGGYVKTAKNLTRDQWKAIIEKATTEDILAILNAVDNGKDLDDCSSHRAKQNARAHLRM